MDVIGYPECASFQIIALSGGYLYRSNFQNFWYYVRMKDPAAMPEIYPNRKTAQNPPSAVQAVHPIFNPTDTSR